MALTAAEIDELEALMANMFRGDKYTQGDKFLCSYEDGEYRNIAEAPISSTHTEWDNNSRAIMVLINAAPALIESARRETALAERVEGLEKIIKEIRKHAAAHDDSKGVWTVDLCNKAALAQGGKDERHGTE